MPFLADRFEKLLTDHPSSLRGAAVYTAAAFLVAGIITKKLDEASEDFVKENNLSPRASIQPFDGRFGGYSVEGAHEYIEKLGPHGRYLYLVLEVYDYVFIMAGYTMLLGLLAAWLGSKRRLVSGEQASGNLYDTLVLLPVIALVFDVIENACQILITTTLWNPSSPSSVLWRALVESGSTFVKLKWSCILAYAAVYLITLGSYWRLRSDKGPRSQGASPSGGKRVKGTKRKQSKKE